MIKHFCKLTPMQKCISLLIILLSFNVYSEPRWQLYKNEQGVSIEYQEFSDDTFVVKGQLNIEDVTANDFLDLLSDTRIASSWLENTSKVRVIKALSPSENLVYSYIDSPWPVANRDAVTYSCYSRLSPQQTKLSIESRPKELPLTKRVVRIKTLNAHWLLTQKGEDLNIEYQVYALPGGNIPTWLYNKVGLKSTFKTLVNLRTILETKSYTAIEPVIKVGSCNLRELTVK